MATLLNINNISMWAQGNGILGHNPYPNTAWGLYYPRGTAGVVYTDGFIWGGYVKDGHEPELRVGGQYYNAGTVPGCILSKGIAEDSNDPDVRVWRIRPDWQAADLTQDAAEFFNVSVDSVTKEQIDALRVQYEKDWNEWPWQKGAPFYDTNGNGTMDGDEDPGIAYADQVVWFVANDLDSSATVNLFQTWVGEDVWEPSGSPPIGLEMQITLWAYNRTGSGLNDAFQHIIFKRVRVIYKGRDDTPDNARIDSMFVAQFAYTDLGDYNDNLLGCDTTLQLCYCYNGHDNDTEFRKFDIPPPAIGYNLIQGPLVSSDDPLSQAYFNFIRRSNHINLPISSFWPKSTGAPFTDPVNTLQAYIAMNGFKPREERLIPFLDWNGNPTKFPFSGDPVAGTGCLDGLGAISSFPPGTRRFLMNSGPFTMALGDTQEVIIAIVGGLGSDRLASISVMKHYVKWARCWARSVFQTGLEGFSPEEVLEEDGTIPQDFRLYQNYPNPFNTSTEIRYDLPVQKNVKLTIYNLLGQVVKVLVNEKQDAKSYVIKWDGTDVRSEKVPTGIYIYRIDAGYWVLIKKMMLLQ